MTEKRSSRVEAGHQESTVCCQGKGTEKSSTRQYVWCTMNNIKSRGKKTTFFWRRKGEERLEKDEEREQFR